MKKIYSLIVILMLAISAQAEPIVLDATFTDSWWGDVQISTVDGVTTLTYTQNGGAVMGLWGYDMSAYEYIWLTLTEATEDYYVEVNYADNTKTGENFNVENHVPALRLDDSHKSSVNTVIMVANNGVFKVDKCYLGTKADYEDFMDGNVPIPQPGTEINTKFTDSWWGDVQITTTDGVTTLTYTENGGAVMGWWGRNMSAYDYVWLVLTEATTAYTLQINYAADGSTPSEGVFEAGHLIPAVRLDDANKSSVNTVILIAEQGTLKVAKVYAGTEAEYQEFVNGGTGVTTAKASVNVNDGKLYDLGGREVASPIRGLYIRNGKKVMVK